MGEHAGYFFHPNALGSTGMVMNAYGLFGQYGVQADELYYPWGQRWQLAGSWWWERFASLERRDPDTGLDPTLNRMYASTQGRWLSPDPLAGDITNPQSLNRYAYVLNNATNLIDPLGLECSDVVNGTIHCTSRAPAPRDPFLDPFFWWIFWRSAGGGRFFPGRQELDRDWREPRGRPEPDDTPPDPDKTIIRAAPPDPNRTIITAAPPFSPPDTRPSCYTYAFGLLFGVEELIKTTARDQAIELTAKETKSALENKKVQSAVSELLGRRVKKTAFKAGGKVLLKGAEDATLALGVLDIINASRQLYNAIEAGECRR